MEVALPTDVIGPVRLAFVVTVAAAIAVLQAKPMFVIHWSALEDNEQPPMGSAVGATGPDVAFPMMVLAFCVLSAFKLKVV
jgi:hypothetical protein